MTLGRLLGPSHWDDIRLVAFDVDGTLYSQYRLRVRMMRAILLDAASKRALDTIRILRTYRRLREQLAEREVPDFENALAARTASATGCTADQVRSILEEWIERRPLPYCEPIVIRGW
jgi:putative hydrolase of the HAD superfamily